MRGQTDDCSDQPAGQPPIVTERSAVIGTWMWTARSGFHVLDQGAAEILTGSPDLADSELPLDVVMRRIHPEDRSRFLTAVRRAEGESGVVAVEYRVRTSEGWRWLLDHGRTYPEVSDQPAHGHGVLIDITQQKLLASGAKDGEEEGVTPLERAARHALSARKAIGEDGSDSLRLLVDMLLLEVGRVIARRVSEDRVRGLN